MYTTSATLLAGIADSARTESWQVFYERYMPLIYKMAKQQGLSDADSEDVVQLVMVAVLQGIQRFDHTRGPFRRWLLGITTRKIVDVMARTGRARRRVDQVPVLPDQEDPLVQEWDRRWRQSMLQQAIDTVRRSTEELPFQAFWLRVVANWPVKSVAATLGIDVQRVYDYKHRIARRIAADYQARCRAADEGPHR